ncbi:YihY/virulence factor BrkB family protein [Agromyces sp. NPDC058110]|uniref:YihY/virulence factor BrkB family protein n=1 Tax=Agromyces sp. NPDC058110 TaxID=3346345 RepID=UPI0036D7CF19
MAEDTGPVEKHDAPAPDDSRKPDSPTEVEKRSWAYVLKKTWREFVSDQCFDIAASLTYYGMLALFPGLLALASLLGLFGNGEKATRTLLALGEGLVPENVLATVGKPLEQFTSSPAAGWAFVTGLVLAIWSASGYVGAFSRAMNRVYEIEEGRPFWKLRPMQLLVTVIAIVLILIMATILVISGPVTDAIGDAVGAGAVVRFIWSILKWPILAIVLVLMVAILYCATPNAKQPKFRWMSLGALIALIVLLIASFVFALYVANFSNYERTYGTFAGVIIFLLWLWIANLALLFGAEFDAELERGRQLQAGIEAEVNIQLPPRDTRKSKKARAQEEKDIQEGRRLREANADDDSPDRSSRRRSR